MDLCFRHGTVARADDGALTVVLANEGRMGDGLDLQMDGADLKRFKANPVVGFGHNYFGRDSLPIGRVDNLKVDGSRLIGDVAFDQGDEFAVDVERKIRDGFLSAFSIGFDPRDVDKETGAVSDWELFELSVVPIPMDPGALVAAGRDGARAFRDDLLAVAERLDNDETPSRQVLNDLSERTNTGRSTDAVDGGAGGDDNTIHTAVSPQARDRVLKLARKNSP